MKPTIAILFIFGLPSAQGLASGTGERDRLILDEIAAKAKENARRNAAVVVSGYTRAKFGALKDDPNDRGYYWELTRDRDSSKLALVNHARTGYVDRVLISTPRSSFLVRRASADSSYYLESSSLPSGNQEYLEDMQHDLLNAPYMVGNEMLTSYTESRGFKLLKIEPEPPGQDGSGLVKLHFEYASMDPGGGPTGRGKDSRPARGASGPSGTATGWVVLDRDRSWAVTEYEIHRVHPTDPLHTMQLSGAVWYDRAFTDPVPSKIRTRRVTTTRKGTGERNEIHRIESWKFQETPPSAFSLAFYGLGDFASKRGRAFNPYVAWFGVAGLVCLLSAVSFRQIRRRVYSK
jgi:hypothetical protein